MLTFGLVLTLGLVLAPPASHAQGSSGPYWVALDSLPAGTPAQLTFQAAVSDPSQSVVNLRISGFWVTQKVGTDSRSYQDIQVPGLPNSMQVGAPRLPVARFDLGLVTGSSYALFGGEQAQRIVYVHGLHVWPKPIGAQFHEGSDEQFAINDTIYSSAGFWPSSVAPSTSLADSLAGCLPDVSILLNPLRWDPGTDDMEVHSNSSYTFVHPGPAQQQATITGKRAGMLGSLVFNWQLVKPYVPVNPIKYTGDFLFIYPARYENDIAPLVLQKLTRGFAVTELTTESAGSDCDHILGAIRAWYQSVPFGHDCFCILAGNSDDIGLCNSGLIFGYPEGVLTDDLYGSLVERQLDKRVLVGRLSPVDAADLDQQAARILAYEDTPPANAHFGSVILAAHHGNVLGGPIKDFQEDVRTATYADPPSFITQYGSDGATNATLETAIDGGAGLMCYLGHGTALACTTWSSLGEDFRRADASLLTNAPRTPVMWLLACQNGNLPVPASIGQSLMRLGGNGAVACYCATNNVEVDATVTLDGFLFSQVYDKGNTIQGYAYAGAEHSMEDIFGEGDGWKFLLLGDPQMTIRRGIPPPVRVSRPAVTFCGSGCSQIDLYASLSDGTPVTGAKAAVWKRAASPGGTGIASEVLDNRYTDTSGRAQIPAPFLGNGTLYYSLETDDGFSMRDSVPIVNGVVSVGLAASEGRARLAAIPSVTRGGTRFSFGRPLPAAARVLLLDVSGRRVRSLNVRAGQAEVIWDGRDERNEAVASGLYLGHIDDGRGSSPARVIILR